MDKRAATTRSVTGPTIQERANAAIRETAQVRRGHWKGDRSFQRFGATLLDRYEALAREVAGKGDGDAA